MVLAGKADIFRAKSLSGFEAEMTVFMGVNTHFSRGRGLNYSMCKQLNFVLMFGSTWLTNICPPAVQNALSASIATG